MPKSKIYEEDPSRWSAEEEGADSSSKLRHLMSDRKFHQIAEMLGTVDSQTISSCFTEMKALTADGWIFERTKHHFRMRLREQGEPLPDTFCMAREVELAFDLQEAIEAQGGR